MPNQTISEFAKRFGLSRSTLLYYDRIGLLKPAGTSPAGYRLYGEREKRRMMRINTFRKAGLPLQAIREVLDEKDGNVLKTALEQRLSVLNEEIECLRDQQQVVLQLLRRTEHRISPAPVSVEQWVAMLKEAGIDEDGLHRWHRAFERDAPDAHQQFLESLGLNQAAIDEIRNRSRQEIKWS